jgi:hypothetical protein
MVNSGIFVANSNLKVPTSIISKPGYSTFAEALRINATLISLTRNDFAEAQLLLNGIQNYGYHQILQPEEFFRGNWDFLRQIPLSPQQNITLDKNGSQIIAQEIINYLATIS